jgi:hypothetical protein
MNAKDFASILDGRETCSEVDTVDIVMAKHHNMLIIFCRSDDTLLIKGAVDMQFNIFCGATVDFGYDKLQAVWCREPMHGASWELDLLENNYESHKFSIHDYDYVHCIGIVINLKRNLK